MVSLSPHLDAHHNSLFFFLSFHFLYSKFSFTFIYIPTFLFFLDIRYLYFFCFYFCQVLFLLLSFHFSFHISYIFLSIPYDLNSYNLSIYSFITYLTYFISPCIFSPHLQLHFIYISLIFFSIQAPRFHSTI